MLQIIFLYYKFCFSQHYLFIPPIIYLVSRFKNQEFVLENYGMPSHIQRISERERLKKELEIAAKVQLSLLPKEEPKIPDMKFLQSAFRQLKPAEIILIL